MGVDKKKITNIEVKKKNRNEVFRYICKQETVSNPEISYNMKISLPTATQITKELIAEGLLEENAMIAAYSEDLYASISIASIDYSVSGEAEPDSAIVSVKHRTGGEDSFVYLTMELSRTDGQWQAGWIALEK